MQTHVLTEKQILLRLEKYPHRMNFAKGILESRRQTYRHLEKLLKPIPLETPITIELMPGKHIKVTLFDANHCPGSVMFLIQGDHKAILYTGDIRSETWWINSLVQNPILLPYTLGSRKLNRIYLDTTFATKSDIYHTFPSKAEGIRELLDKISRYPLSTQFHFQSWTFGYENVWVALSYFLESRIHLDKYRFSLYDSLRSHKGPVPCKEAPSLAGFIFGNHQHHGCITTDDSVRLHGCEHVSGCRIFEDQKKGCVVKIVPIVTRTADGLEFAEAGAGGGQADLDQVNDLEVELENQTPFKDLIQLCERSLTKGDPQALVKALSMLIDTIKEPYAKVDSKKRIADVDAGTITLARLVDLLNDVARRASGSQGKNLHPISQPMSTTSELDLREMITFPYSRHSSYSELRELVAAFHPCDIYPCTVNAAYWTPAYSMRSLFGDLCSDDVFEHDQVMMAHCVTGNEPQEHRENVARAGDETQRLKTPEKQDDNNEQTTSYSGMEEMVGDSEASFDAKVPSKTPPGSLNAGQYAFDTTVSQYVISPPSASRSIEKATSVTAIGKLHPTTILPRTEPGVKSRIDLVSPSCHSNDTTQPGSLSEQFSSLYSNAIQERAHASDSHMSLSQRISVRNLAYNAALGIHGYDWNEFGGLSSVKYSGDKEVEL
jgi:DNA cross-link repair 1C protein